MPDKPEFQDQRPRSQLLSEGHNPPRFVDRRLPTYDVAIFADGGPGKTGFRSQGSNPWILGSLTIGSNKVWCVDRVMLNAGSPNVWFKLRHSHSGSSSIPGGTLESWHLPSRGQLGESSGPDSPLLAIRGPGTVFLYGFGAGSLSGTTSNRLHKTLGTRGQDRFAGKVRGFIV